MTEQDPSTPPSKKNIAGELILPVGALAFTIYYIFTVIESPWTAQVNAFMVGSILLAVIGIFLISRIVMLVQGSAQFHVTFDRLPDAIKSRQSGFIGLTILYLIVIESIGFTLTTALFFWGSMLLLDYGKAPLAKLALAVFMALVAYGIFILVLKRAFQRVLLKHFWQGLSEHGR